MEHRAGIPCTFRPIQGADEKEEAILDEMDEELEEEGGKHSLVMERKKEWLDERKDKEWRWAPFTMFAFDNVSFCFCSFFGSGGSHFNGGGIGLDA